MKQTNTIYFQTIVRSRFDDVSTFRFRCLKIDLGITIPAWATVLSICERRRCIFLCFSICCLVALVAAGVLLTHPSTSIKQTYRRTHSKIIFESFALTSISQNFPLIRSFLTLFFFTYIFSTVLAVFFSWLCHLTSSTLREAYLHSMCPDFTRYIQEFWGVIEWWSMTFSNLFPGDLFCKYEEAVFILDRTK